MIKPSLAIVGTGVAGLGCAHFLRHRFDLALFEQNSHVGGHSNTVTVPEDGRELPVDTGFMVFNHVTYPHLTRLFRELDVPTKPTSMSFSVRHEPGGVEYNGRDLNTLFGQRKNLVRPRYWRFLLKINRFNQETVEALEDPAFAGMTLGEYARHRDYGQDFLDWYIIPMASAVWSTPPELMLEFPAVTLMRFWFNHGFLGMRTRHPWWTVDGGSREYVRRMTQPFAERIRTGDAVQRVRRLPDGGHEIATAAGRVERFDRVILACHGDEALALLEDPSPRERELLSRFKYQENLATLHTDPSFMPRTRLCWASWNYQVWREADGGRRTSTHYWMNSLQGVSEKTNYFVSINAPGTVRPEKVLRTIRYHHPLFDLPAIAAQRELPGLNEEGQTTGRQFCGSYFRYGFHEDAFGSAVDLSRLILGGDPWNLAGG
jgi:predicted NAD/FAD-binding protein